MPLFVIRDHPKLPVVVARIEKRREETDRDGFRLRYVAKIPEGHADAARTVIEMLDDRMGKATRAPGVYQAKYEAVREAYSEVLPVPAVRKRPLWLRCLAGATAFALIFGMIACLTFVVPFLLFFGAIKKQSGFAFMAEVALVTDFFDWRPTIARLIDYAKEA